MSKSKEFKKEFKKFTPKENIEPVCDICGGLHKTSNHEESLAGKKEFMNPVCEICKEPHKTSQHPYEEVFDKLSQDLHPSKAEEGPFYDKTNYPDKKHEDLNEPKFKGSDGQYYEDKMALEEANRRFTEQMNPRKEKKDF